MKIFVLNVNQNVEERGVEIFWKNLKRELGEKDIDVKIAASDKKIQQNKSPNIFFKLLRRFYLDRYSLHVLFFTLWQLPYLQKYNPDIVIPTNGGWQTLIIRLIGKYKIVIIGHAGIGHDDEFNVRHGGTDLFIAITKEQEEWAKKINTTLKVMYIPNGVDTKRFSPEGEKFNYQLPRPIFLAVASLEKYKNIHRTIQAVSELPKGSLIILGRGEEEENLKILCDEKLRNRYLLKKINHVDLPKYYRGANVFTLASGKQEAFGLVYLEAMSCGLPCVATDDEKRHEIIGEAGLFVDPDNIQEYAKMIEKAAEIGWGNKPIEQAEKFSWKIVAAEYCKLFQNICVETHHDASLQQK